MRSISFSLLLSAAHMLAVAVADDEASPSPVVPRPVAPKWAEVKADADGRVWLRAPGDKAAGEWELIDRSGAFLDVPPGATVAVFAAVKPGAYRVIAVSDGKLVRYIVTVGDAPPIPPGPGPGPQPPVPPKPVDELTKQLQTAFDSDTTATKAADLKQLIGLYTEASTFAKDAKFTTAADLFAAVSAASASLLPDIDGVRRLAGIRGIVRSELNAVIPTDPDAPLTEAVRSAASVAFAKYATALKGVMSK